MSILLALAAVAAALQPAPKPGTSATFKDWTVACDNIRHCTAVQLLPEDAAIDALFPRAVVERGGAASAPAMLRVTLDGQKAGQAVLWVDGRQIARIALDRNGEGRIALTKTSIAALTQGQSIGVRAHGAVLARGSLAGLAAALRYIDAQQRRADGVTALVATGPAAASVVPLVPAAPVVRAVRPPSGARRLLGTAQSLAFKKRFDCDGDIGGPTESEVYPLAPGKALVLLACGSGAYNFSTVPLILVGKAATVAPFDLTPEWGEGKAMLVNASWDPKAATLESYAKGRGIGDCGVAQRFVWDGIRFRLVAQTEMGECRGSREWMRTWTATVR